MESCSWWQQSTKKILRRAKKIQSCLDAGIVVTDMAWKEEGKNETRAMRKRPWGSKMYSIKRSPNTPTWSKKGYAASSCWCSLQQATALHTGVLGASSVRDQSQSPRAVSRARLACSSDDARPPSTVNLSRSCRCARSSLPRQPPASSSHHHG